VNTGRRTPFELVHDCEATLIPSGQKMSLRAGDRVLVVQALGGTVTVQTDSGYLARISAEDVRTLGLMGETPDREVEGFGALRSGACD